MIDITHAEIATWFFDCSRLYPGGANELLNYMRAMFNAARRWEYLPQNHQNPATGIRRNRPQRKAQLLNQPEVKRLLEAIENLPDRWPSEAAAIRMLLFTGCRRGEILNLSWDQVRDDRLLLSDSKTGPRTVILNADAREVIEAQVRRRSKGVALVFPRQRSANALEHLNAPWKEVKRQAKLPPTLRLHDLRHTFASHAVMGGTTLFVAGRLLGHKRAETTARYAHLLDDHLQEAAEKVAADLRRTMRPPAPPPAAAHVTASPGNNRPRRPSWQSETHDPEQISAAMAELNEFIATYKPPKKSQATGNPTNENLLPDISDICRSY